MDDEQIKALLRIQLYAGEVLVAETDDPTLWQRVLALLTRDDDEDSNRERVAVPDTSATVESPSDPVLRFADLLELPEAVVQSALAPSEEPPFLYLDARIWEAFTKNFPSRGRGSVPAVVLALTALALWFDCLRTNPPTTTQAQAVLRTIYVTGRNLTRSVDNCDWLQKRGNQVAVSPAEVSRAVAVVRAFCMKQPLTGNA